MSSFFGKLKSGTSTNSQHVGSSPSSKKDGHASQPTPLEKMLKNAGPIRNDGSDKFWGMENFGNTCYCNSILQCLYYSVPFRENILSYPQFSQPDQIAAAAKTAPPHPPLNLQQNGNNKKPTVTPTARNPGGPQPQQKPEDKDSPEYKKKQALLVGPILNMAYQNNAGYDMPETLFTSLKDIFEAVVVNQSRHGVVSPFKFLQVLRKENEMFRSAMHQDAHEFLNLLLNAVMENIETHDNVLKEKKGLTQQPEAPQDPFADPSDEKDRTDSGATIAFPSILPTPEVNNSPTRWLHELFEGTLTSETRCLTCENTSQRDEPFLDLSVDLEQHSSVTACLRRFSEEEMLCERNKFHCDNCGGLQEAEKRMKIKRLPKVLALHLKRFKYTEDLQRLQKLFHKVVYPYHLRLFNTTDDAADPDRLYELYAVVVHIGGGPYHGHYIAIIKTQDRGWLLFDDEMVEPVDKSYVRNFFGDRPGLACAYVLFYQETTLEAVQKEQRNEGRRRASQDMKSGGTGLGVPVPPPGGVKESAELHRVQSDPVSPGAEAFASLDHAATAPSKMDPNGHVDPPRSPTIPSMPAAGGYFNNTNSNNTTTSSNNTAAANAMSIPSSQPSAIRPTSPIVQSKKESKKEEKAAEKSRKAAEKQAEKERREAEVERRKDLSKKLADARVKQEDDLKKALEASRLSALEEAEGRGPSGGEADEHLLPPGGAGAGANGTGNGAGNGTSSPSGLDRFKRSKSLRFGSLGSKKEKNSERAPLPAFSEPRRAGTDLEKMHNLKVGAGVGGGGGANGTSTTVGGGDSTSALVDDGEKDGKEGKEGKEKEKKSSRFSIRKKSFGML